MSTARLLADHLETICTHSRGLGQVAEAIIANPQSHVDALVAAGVLERRIGAPACWHMVVPSEPPHIHDWGCKGSATTGVKDHYLARWSCRSCPETTTTDIVPPL